MRGVNAVRVRSTGLAFFLVGLSACASPQVGGDPGRNVQPTLSLQVVNLGENTPVPPTSGIRSGERVAVKVTLGKAAFLYVAQVDPTGAAEALFPLDAEQQLPKGSSLTLPQQGSGFTLVPPMGEETLVAIAADQPLGQIEPKLCRDLKLRCADAPPILRRGDEDEKSKIIDINSRGQRTWLGADQTLHGAAATGLTILRFSFRQTPK